VAVAPSGAPSPASRAQHPPQATDMRMVCSQEVWGRLETRGRQARWGDEFHRSGGLPRPPPALPSLHHLPPTLSHTSCPPFLACQEPDLFNRASNLLGTRLSGGWCLGRLEQRRAHRRTHTLPSPRPPPPLLPRCRTHSAHARLPRRLPPPHAIYATSNPPVTTTLSSADVCPQVGDDVLREGSFTPCEAPPPSPPAAPTEPPPPSPPPSPLAAPPLFPFATRQHPHGGLTSARATLPTKLYVA